MLSILTSKQGANTFVYLTFFPSQTRKKKRKHKLEEKIHEKIHDQNPEKGVNVYLDLEYFIFIVK